MWRVDRARQHEDARVLEVREREEVSLLHGPPRDPQYSAQLERQNREHREATSRSYLSEHRLKRGAYRAPNTA